MALAPPLFALKSICSEYPPVKIRALAVRGTSRCYDFDQLREPLLPSPSNNRRSRARSPGLSVAIK